MDAEERWAHADDDTSPEVPVSRARTATEPGPRPPEPEDDVRVVGGGGAGDHEEVRVIEDPDATAAIGGGSPGEDEGAARLPLDEPAPPDPGSARAEPGRRRATRPEPTDDLDAWSSFATSGPRWRDQRPATAADDETAAPERRPPTSRRARRAAPEAGGEDVATGNDDEVVPDAELGIPGRLGRRWRRVRQRDPGWDDELTADPAAALGAEDDERDAEAPPAPRRRSGRGAPAPTAGTGDLPPAPGTDETGDPVLRPASRVVRGRPRTSAPEAGADPTGETPARQRPFRPGGRPPTGAPAGEARPGATADRDLPRAIAFGVGIAAAALLAFAIGPGVAVAFVTVVIAVAAAELFGTLQRVGHQPATLLGLVAATALPLAAYWRGEPALPLVLALTVVASFLWYLTGVSRVQPTLNAAVTVLGVGWVGLLGAFAALLLAFPNGTGALIGVVLAVVANDVGALAVGRRAGRRLLAPSVSPRKTWEGVLGGAVASVVVSVVVLGIVGLTPWDAGSALALGLVVAVAAPLGDLCESMVKRDLGVKDMGSLLPGHGGLLDRFDGLLFSLPAAYYLCRLLDVF